MSLFQCCCPCFSSSEYTSIPDQDTEDLYPNAVNLSNLNRSIELSSATHTNGHAASPAPASTPHGSIEIPSVATPNASTLTSTLSPIPTADQGNIFHLMPDNNPDDMLFDRESAVFKGMVAQQKFFSKSSYDPKYVWINLKSRTLCLSEHNTRDRSHKEASLADVTGVIAGPPERFKGPVGADGQPVKVSYETCLSVKFVRGGGIDLKFASVPDRDLWYTTMVRIIAQQKELEMAHAAH